MRIDQNQMDNFYVFVSSYSGKVYNCSEGLVKDYRKMKTTESTKKKTYLFMSPICETVLCKAHLQFSLEVTYQVKVR